MSEVKISLTRERIEQIQAFYESRAKKSFEELISRRNTEPLELCHLALLGLEVKNHSLTSEGLNLEDHACSTGDCPHEKQSECDKELEYLTPTPTKLEIKLDLKRLRELSEQDYRILPDLVIELINRVEDYENSNRGKEELASLGNTLLEMDCECGGENPDGSSPICFRCEALNKLSKVRDVLGVK